MWDGWEATRGCVRRSTAELRGYARAFNKASTRNWGTKEHPCPTLNLIKLDTGRCRGIAFEFPDDREQAILEYLTKREGKGFVLRTLPARLETGGEISAIIPIYEGTRRLATDMPEIADMVLRAGGKEGPCIDYVNGIADELRRLGIDDPVVSELWRTLA